MKGKTKQEKGITLIALIITIVVLLILAVVTIGAIKNDGIISYADNSATKYKDAQTKEEDILGQYESYLSGRWTQEGATLTKTSLDGKQVMQIKIGDYVNYVEGSHTHTPDVTKGAGTGKTTANGGIDLETGKHILTTSEVNTSTQDLNWRVLGINEKGQIELISDDQTTQRLYLGNDEGYVYAIDNLNKFCDDLYGKGEYATGARSLTVKDIDKLTKYDSTTHSENGRKWIYRYPTQAEMDAFTGETNSTRYMQYSNDGGENWNNITNQDAQTFKIPGEEKIISEENPGSIEVTSEFFGYYDYKILENVTEGDGYTSEEIVTITDMIMKNSSGNKLNYWLATKLVRPTADSTTFSLCVLEGTYYYCIMPNGGGYSYQYKPNNNNYSPAFLGSAVVRPVVTLSSNATLTDFDSETNMWQITVK